MFTPLPTMKSILLAIALVFAQCEATAAPSTEVSVERLLELMNARATIEQSYALTEKMMRGMAQQSIGPRPLTDAEVKSLDSTVSKAVALMKEEMNWDKLKPEFVRLYVKTFTEEELNALIEFYGSPTGQAFIRKMPAIIQGSMEISQSQMKRLMPKMMRIVQESARQ
jgi:uncharacterized protein